MSKFTGKRKPPETRRGQGERVSERKRALGKEISIITFNNTNEKLNNNKKND